LNSQENSERFRFPYGGKTKRTTNKTKENDVTRSWASSSVECVIFFIGFLFSTNNSDIFYIFVSNILFLRFYNFVYEIL